MENIRKLLQEKAKSIPLDIAKKLKADVELVRERCLEKGVSPEEVCKKSKNREEDMPKLTKEEFEKMFPGFNYIEELDNDVVEEVKEEVKVKEKHLGPFFFINDKGYSVHEIEKDVFDNLDGVCWDGIGQWMICDSKGIALSWNACKGYEELDKITVTLLSTIGEIS